MSKKVLIVGGVAGGASCAARLRRLDEDAEIIMFERGDYISFANCGLPYHISGVIDNREELLLQTPESFNNRFDVEVRIHNEVVSIDKDKKQVVVKDLGKNKEYTENYDVLVLSPGSSPLRPPIEGIDSDKIMSLWNINDMDSIKSLIKIQSPKSAAVIGGGFIGLEMVENLKDIGIDVTVVEMANQVMTPIDYDMAQIAHKHLNKKGVKLVLGDGVKSFKDTGKSVIVNTQQGKEIEAELVILAIGVRPNNELAKSCGLEVNARGGIVIDDTLKTSDPNIYAVGDVVEVTNFIDKSKTMIPLAGPANKMGRMAADNICGMSRKYNGTQGSSVAKVFDLTIASTGLNEKQLNQSGLSINKDYRITLIHPMSHASYYPGGKPMTIKLIFDLKGKVLGAQAVGYEGVEKRIDVIATAIRFNATVYDLEELELCYAPPYSSGKDPVNMAGFSGENILSGTINNITVPNLIENKDNLTILDVRTLGEVKMGKIEGSINIPVDDLRKRLGELDKSKTYAVHCAVGIRSYIACRILMQNGFENILNISGGYISYDVVSKDYTYKG